MRKVAEIFRWIVIAVLGVFVILAFLLYCSAKKSTSQAAQNSAPISPAPPDFVARHGYDIARASQSVYLALAGINIFSLGCAYTLPLSITIFGFIIDTLLTVGICACLGNVMQKSMFYSELTDSAKYCQSCENSCGSCEQTLCQQVKN